VVAKIERKKALRNKKLQMLKTLLTAERPK
jgi:hypothetical protein